MAITMLAGYLVIINAAALLMMATSLSGCNTWSRLTSIGKEPELAPIQNPVDAPGYQAVSRSPAGRQRRGMGGHVSVPPQNQALVFCGGYAADSGRTAGRWGVAGREQRPGLNNRNALPEQ